MIASLCVAVALAQTAWTKPYTILSLPQTVEAFAKELPEVGKGRVWREGDVLKAVYRGEAEAVDLTVGIQEPMTRFEGTDTWGLQLRYGQWDKALVAYAFLPQPPPQGFKFDMQTWRGESGPRPPAPASPLSGTLRDAEFESKFLGEKRKVTVYVPPGPAEARTAIVMADGQGVSAFAAVLEPLIVAKRVRPIILIGIHNGGFRGSGSAPDLKMDFRAREYLQGVDPERFAQHLDWVVEEVLPWARGEYPGLSSRREDWCVTGFSNGGSFAAWAATLRGNVFGTSIPLSLGFPPPAEPPKGPLARFYFAAGSLESFSVRTKQAYERAKAWGAETTYKEFVAGHDSVMWQIAFVEAVETLFPASAGSGPHSQ